MILWSIRILRTLPNRYFDLSKTLSHPKIFHPCFCQGQISWEPAFVQHETHQLKKNSLAATIPVLEKEWRIVFEVQVKRSRGAGNILHLSTGVKGTSTRDYILLVSLHPTGGFKVSFPVDGEILEKHFPESALSFGQQWYEIQIMQVFDDSKYIYGVFIDKKKVLYMENREPTPFENVDVYTTSPWYKSQKGSIRGWRIENRKPEERTKETSLLDFYNTVMTFNESFVEVTCCTIKGTPISMSCGLGTSCFAVCYSKDTTLCPSGNCKDCEEELHLEGKERQCTMQL